jgi:pantoate--beta-alanine ligase
MVAPDRAYFGRKDAQQVAVIRRLVADLDIPVAIESCPTVREGDGLAMSSRNALLSAEERRHAAGLYAGLRAGGALAARGERDARALLAGVRRAIEPFEIELEYVALVDPDSFEPVGSLERDSLLVMAGRVGEVRMIDNLLLSPASADAFSQTRQREEALAACSV